MKKIAAVSLSVSLILGCTFVANTDTQTAQAESDVQRTAKIQKESNAVNDRQNGIDKIGSASGWQSWTTINDFVKAHDFQIYGYGSLCEMPKEYSKPVGTKFKLDFKRYSEISISGIVKETNEKVSAVLPVGKIKLTRHASNNVNVAALDKDGYVTVKGCGTCELTPKFDVYDKEGTWAGNHGLSIRVSGILTQPKLKAKNKKGKKAKISWNKVQGAGGYELYVKLPGKKKYKKAVTRSARVKGVTHRGLSKGKVYTYKVRACKKFNGKMRYSKFSKPVKVKIKK